MYKSRYSKDILPDAELKIVTNSVYLVIPYTVIKHDIFFFKSAIKSIQYRSINTFDSKLLILNLRFLRSPIRILAI